MNYSFKASPTFWKALHKLSDRQKDRAREVFRIFRKNPFDPRLGTHKIHRLSAIYGRTIHAVVIEGDLRAVFYIKESTVCTVDIGTHDVYKR